MTAVWDGVPTTNPQRLPILLHRPQRVFWSPLLRQSPSKSAMCTRSSSVFHDAERLEGAINEGVSGWRL